MKQNTGGGSSGGSREVVYTLGIAVDKAAASRIKGLTDAVSNGQKAIDAAREKSAKADEQLSARVVSNRAKMLDRIRRHEEAKERDQMRAGERMAREEDRRITAAGRAAEKAIKDDERRQARFTAAVQKETASRAAFHAEEAKRRVAAGERVAAQVEALNAKQKTAGRTLAEASKMGLEGITSLARGFVLLGIADEDNLQKALRTLAKFQAAFDIIRGGVTTFMAITKAMEAYRTATAAAAAANVLLAGSQVAAGSTVGAGAAAASPLLLAGAAGAAVVTAGLYAADVNGFREGLDTLTGGGPGVASGNRVQGFVGRQQQARAQAASNADRATAERQMRFGTMTESENPAIADRYRRQAVGELNAARDGTRADFDGPAGGVEREAAHSRHAEAASRVAQIEKDKLATMREQRQVALDRIRSEMDGLRQQKAGILSLIQAERSRFQSETARFAQMSPAEQARVRALGEKTRRGEALTQKEREEAMASGISSIAGVAEAQASFEGQLTAPELFTDQTKRINNLQAQAGKITLELVNAAKVEVQIAQNTKEQIDQIVAKLDEILAERDRATLAAIDQRFANQQFDQNQANVAAAAGAQ